MNKCKTCDMNCSGMCAKDWESLSDDNYKPGSIIAWLGVAVIAWCGFFMWWVLS